MCSIDKLLIKGVRSFSPSNQNVIEFYRPLTLIVGQNGAGKTVCCCKMMDTGCKSSNGCSIAGIWRILAIAT
jgi:DNA repair protein RAD50